MGIALDVLHDHVQEEEGAMLSWMGLRSRLVLLVLIAVSPAFALLAWTTFQQQPAAQALAQANLKTEVVLAASAQRQVIDRVRQLLRDISSGPSIKDPTIRLCEPYLRNLQAQDSAYVALGVAGLDGKVTCHSSGPGANGVYVGDRSYFTQALGGQKFAVGDHAVGRSTGKPGLGFGIPVYGDNGKPNGVAFVVLDLAAFSRALPENPGPHAAKIEVIDRSGVLLAVQPATQGVVGTSVKDGVLLQALRQPQTTVRESPDSSGLPNLYAYTPIGDGGDVDLLVAVSVPRSSIMAQSLGGFTVDLAILVGMSLLGIFAAWWVGGRLVVRPAGAILKGADEVAQGRLFAKIPDEFAGDDELGRIARAHNRMTVVLGERNAQLGRALDHIGKEHAKLELIIKSMSEGLIAVDRDGRFLLFNAAAKTLLPKWAEQTSVASSRGEYQFLMLDGLTPYSEEEGPLACAVRGELAVDWDVVVRGEGEADRVLRLNLQPVRDEAGAAVGGLMVFSDITERKATEDFVRAQEQVLELIATGVPLIRSMEAVVRLIEGMAPQSLCTILLVEGDVLRHLVAVKMPESFCQEIGHLPIGPGMGACGTAAHAKAPVFIDDLETDPAMADYRQIARKYGLRSCWSTPVVSSAGEVIATFAVYRREPSMPQARDLTLIDTAVRLARIALERSMAESALRQSEARFRELAGHVEDVFYNRDAATGRVLYVSPAYAKVWGRSCESLYADPASYFEAVHVDDRAALNTAAQDNLQGRDSVVEYRVLRPNGEIRWVRDQAYVVANAAGGIERVVGTARDITMRKLADLELARSNRALQMLGQGNKALIRISDEAQLLAEVCRVAVDIGNYRMAWVGYASDDAGKAISPMAHAGEENGYLSSITLSWREDQPDGQGPAGQTIRSGQPQQSEDIGAAENNFLWHEAAYDRGFRSALFLPLRDGARTFGLLGLYAGEVQHFQAEEVRLLQELADNLAFGIGSLRARLERRRNEAAARQAAEKLREQASLLDRAKDAFLVLNLDKTIRFWSRGAERLYGWDAAEVLGKTMEDKMYRNPAVLHDAMQQTLDSGGDWTVELEQVARDGSTLYVEGRWTVVRDAQGEIRGVLCVNTDIRERRRVRDQILALNASLEDRVLQRTAQLEFANKQLESFSYSVSHDLRTPLSAIDGFSDMLDKTLGKGDDDSLAERGRHYLNRIRAGVAQMGELIDAMLMLAQVSRSNLRWEPVNLSEAANSLLAGYAEREPSRAASLTVTPGVIVQGDPRLLKQVLDNLLGNAWKFTGAQPSAAISFGVEKNDAGETVYFVRDNGAGFDMAYSDKLFGAFQRLHGQSEFVGTGIGLATVQRIIARHGGRIWADAAVGHGATFYFTLGSESA